MEEKKERIIECPLNEATLADIDFDRARILKSINDLDENIKRLEKSALLLDIHDARNLLCEIQVHNVRNGATAVAQYCGIAKMMLENMREDMAFIRDRRKQFKQDMLRHFATIDAMEKEKERREKERDRLREKRASDSEIEEIASKKYQRPNKRSDN